MLIAVTKFLMLGKIDFAPQFPFLPKILENFTISFVFAQYTLPERRARNRQLFWTVFWARKNGPIFF